MVVVLGARAGGEGFVVLRRHSITIRQRSNGCTTIIQLTREYNRRAKSKERSIENYEYVV